MGIVGSLSHALLPTFRALLLDSGQCGLRKYYWEGNVRTPRGELGAAEDTTTSYLPFLDLPFFPPK